VYVLQNYAIHQLLHTLLHNRESLNCHTLIIIITINDKVGTWKRHLRSQISYVEIFRAVQCFIMLRQCCDATNWRTKSNSTGDIIKAQHDILPRNIPLETVLMRAKHALRYPSCERIKQRKYGARRAAMMSPGKF